MGEMIFSLYDLIQIGLMLLACYCCKAYGYQKGVLETLEYFETNGIIDIPTEDTIEEEKQQVVKNTLEKHFWGIILAKKSA